MLVVLDLSNLPPWLRGAILRYQGAALQPEVVAELGDDFEAPPDVVDLQLALNAETDRGCALLAAAVLDDRLADLLRAVFVNDKAAKKLLEDRGGLGSFASRIDACFCLGLLPREAREDLDLVRGIRNHFAHAAESLTFESESVRSRAQGLHLRADKSIEQDARAVFSQATMALLGLIEATTANSKRADIPPLDLDDLRRDLSEAHPKVLEATQRVLDRKARKYNGSIFRLSYRVGGALGRLARRLSKPA